MTASRYEVCILDGGMGCRAWDMKDNKPASDPMPFCAATRFVERLNKAALAEPQRAAPCCERLDRVIASHQRVLDLLAEVRPGLMADLGDKLLHGLAEAQDLMRGGERG